MPPDDTTLPLAPVTIGRRHTRPAGFETFHPNVPSVDLDTPNPVGRMVIDLIASDGGMSHYPIIRFEPVGMFTSGLFERHSLHFCQEIERAQAAVRNTQRQAEREKENAA